MMIRRVCSLVLAFVLILGMLPAVIAGAASAYSVDEALRYAKEHWNDGQGWCAEYVSRCVIAGGLRIDVQTGTGGFRNAIELASGLKMQPLRLNADGYATKQLNEGNLAAGDVVVQWCSTHSIAPHVLLCGGFDANGYATFYAHNDPLNNQVYCLGLNESYEHTDYCDMGGQVIRLSELDPFAPTDAVSFQSEADTAAYSARLTGSIAFGTIVPSAVSVYFGSSGDRLYPYFDTAISDPSNPVSLDLSFTNLEHNTTYYYQIRAVVDGITWTDSIRSFTTQKDYNPIAVSAETQCGYQITVPAYQDVYCYDSPTSREICSHYPAREGTYTLFCTKRITMSDGTVRYCLADSDGNPMYFRALSNMRCETVHNYTHQTVTQPTCTQNGFITDHCSCGESRVSQWLPPNGHSYDAFEVKPTCTDDGYTLYRCLCGEMYTDQPTAALGHAYGAWIVSKPPTTNAPGEQIRICSRCNAVQARSIAAISQFRDVSRDCYYAEAVDWAVASGITKGMGANTFGPERSCTRAQVVTFLWRAAGSPVPKDEYNPFVDVKPADYFIQAVLWAQENGITQGIDETHFGPDRVCTRAQVTMFLWRYLNQPDPGSRNPFSDVAYHHWYCESVLWAVKAQITNGVDATHFAPDMPCTRAQIVTFLFRALAGNDENMVGSVAADLAGGAVK